MLRQCVVALIITEIQTYRDISKKKERVGVGIGYHGDSQTHNCSCSFQSFLMLVILLCSSVVACLFTQVKIQKESEVRLKIIGTRVDATEIVSLFLSNFECNHITIFF
jgi:hypothetical protein